MSDVLSGIRGALKTSTWNVNRGRPEMHHPIRHLRRKVRATRPDRTRRRPSLEELEGRCLLSGSTQLDGFLQASLLPPRQSRDLIIPSLFRFTPMTVSAATGAGLGGTLISFSNFPASAGPY